MDILLSLAALVALTPIFLLVMAILKLTGEGEVIFLQERIGKDRKPFKLLKFVTMVKGSSQLGTGMIATKDDPRVLKFGRLLRRTKVNELPQLINILKGEMSIIGPRPLPREHYEYYSDQVKRVISRVRPGLSGVGSIVFRDEEIIMGNIKLPCKEGYRLHIAPYKGELEVWYAENQSIWLDLKLILITIVAVLRPSTNIRRFIPGLPPKPAALHVSAETERVNDQPSDKPIIKAVLKSERKPSQQGCQRI